MGRLIKLLFLCLCGCGSPDLVVFTGAASRQPVEELAKEFAARKGVDVLVISGGMGEICGKIEAGQRGDVLISTSDYFLSLAGQKGLADTLSTVTIALCVPCLVVKRGNPKGIKSLDDIESEGVRVVIANPEGTVAGAYAVEILRTYHLNCDIVGLASDAEMVMSYVGTGSADVGITWEHLARNNLSVEPIKIDPKRIPRLARVSGAVITGSSSNSLALEFLAFISSARGKEVFGGYGFYDAPPEGFRGQIDGITVR